MEIRRVTDNLQKRNVTRFIQFSLIGSGYRKREKNMLRRVTIKFFCTSEGDKPVGFLYLKETGRDTIELCVMGALRELHRRGVGRALFQRTKETASEHGYSFIQVKTVQMGKYEEYDKTNKFYLSLGFKEFEVFPTLWDERNPCQIYIMSL